MSRLSSEKTICRFENGIKENYKIKAGDTVVVETCDCFHNQIVSEDQVLLEIDMDIVNPATGPIYIDGAEVGDVLKVDILDIKVAKKGVVATIPGAGGLPKDSEESVLKILEVKNGYVNYLGKEIAINPMIGVIGVAPRKEDGSWGSETPWKHGGNMDTKIITKGSSLYFPVNQKGAMLALGDLHAVMGDGELSFAGLEIPGEVEVKVSVLKSPKVIEWPIVELEDRIEIIASGENLDLAMQEAARIAVGYLQEVLKVSWGEAYVMSSLVVDLNISQVVNPMKTVRASIPKNILEIEDLL